jgi:cytochrome o ubiquinol oxidase subunit 3
VGTHGLHVAMGILWIAILSAQLMVQGDDPQTRSRLLRLGYYWHFLDIVWIGI